MDLLKNNMLKLRRNPSNNARITVGRGKAGEKNFNKNMNMPTLPTLPLF